MVVAQYGSQHEVVPLHLFLLCLLVFFFFFFFFCTIVIWQSMIDEEKIVSLYINNG